MEFDKAVAELEALVDTLEREGDERALLLLELVDAIHRPALERLARGEQGDPIARAVLAMYDLAEVDDEVLVQEALDEVRPYIHSHGGEVELLEVADGVVRVRMSGSCDGCAASTMTLKRGIEASLRDHYPGFQEVIAEQAEGPGPSPTLLQIEGIEEVRQPVFVAAGELDDLDEASVRVVEVEGAAVILANVDGEAYAFRDGCPVDGMSLAGGRLSGNVLVCPWHNCAYDARSGQRVDGDGKPGLTAVPIAVRDGRLEVAVNVA
jgi:Fe-S cluster biogenesis protein NfuA/nitrite reductase/ring-hydroxylating ferredoxin subunit